MTTGAARSQIQIPCAVLWPSAPNIAASKQITLKLAPTDAERRPVTSKTSRCVREERQGTVHVSSKHIDGSLHAPERDDLICHG